MPNISIITAIHNGLAVNRIFFEYLKKYTYYPYELIIIDNLSTDGSREYFIGKGATVIVNKLNYSYPVSQNQGIDAAKGDYLFFLNNDLIVSPQWDKLLIDIATKHSLDILSASGIENMGNYADTRSIGKEWKRIKYPLSLFGYNNITLRLMIRFMYHNWEKYCSIILQKNNENVVEGIVGDNVMLTKKGIQHIGLWDERLQQADFDLFMRSKQRSVLVGDVKPCHIALGVYMHHFGRMTIKYGSSKPIPFADKDNLIKLTDKWSEKEIETYHPNNATLRLSDESEGGI
jgi:glycosyltransferase involved in cell wall biosynthesis